MFEYIGDKLVVDGLFSDPSLPTSSVLKIGESFFMVNTAAATAQPVKEDSLKPYLKKVREEWSLDYPSEYFFRHMIPRGGYVIELERAATSEEFAEICKRFHLSEDDISEVFAETYGATFGEEYQVTVKSRQISLPTTKCCIALEQELLDKGIQASCRTSGRVNIRIA